MTKDDIIRMALKAELHCHVNLTENSLFLEDLEYFVSIVAEDCAQIADKAEPYQCADLIRKRWKQ